MTVEAGADAALVTVRVPVERVGPKFGVLLDALNGFVRRGEYVTMDTKPDALIFSFPAPTMVDHDDATWERYRAMVDRAVERAIGVAA